MVNLLFNTHEMSMAFKRYLHYVMKIEQIGISPFKDPYKLNDAVQQAKNSDLLIVDAFLDGQPKGFQFAKSMRKNTMLFFYFDEIAIEAEGTFWLVLPFTVDRLFKKISAQLHLNPPPPSEYEKLEATFEALKERKGHHK